MKNKNENEKKKQTSIKKKDSVKKSKIEHIEEAKKEEIVAEQTSRMGIFWLGLVILAVITVVLFERYENREVSIYRAIEDIGERTQITADMITEEKVRAREVEKEYILKKKDIVGKFIDNEKGVETGELISSKGLSETLPEELVKVAFASKTLEARTFINASVITYKKISKKEVEAGGYPDVKDILGKYVSLGTEIKEGDIIDPSKLTSPTESINKIPSTSYEATYTFPLDLAFDNAARLYPGDVVNVYFRVTFNGKTSYGKVASDVYLLNVLDGAFGNAYTGTSRNTVSAFVLGTSHRVVDLMKKASSIKGMSSSLVFTPSDEEYVCDYGELVSTKDITEFVELYGK